LRQKGSHATFAKEGKIVIMPVHSRRKIDRGLLLKIIKKELKITREEFEKLLRRGFHKLQHSKPPY
jgi:hypothetical protein